MKVAHLTTAHPRYDTRIFYKECMSLAAAGHTTFLLVADGLADERKDGVEIMSVAKARGRFDRISAATRRMRDAALALRADVYHLHDPELLTIARQLKRAGAKVIFDSHEDVPQQILSKHYLHPIARKVISRLASAYETWVCRRLDAVVAATPYIRDKFLKINPRTVDINNYPLLTESTTADAPSVEREPVVCYVGAITRTRGLAEVVQALSFSKSRVRLLLGGKFNEQALASEIRLLDGWAKVEELGWLDRQSVNHTMRRSMAGLVTLHPTTAYLESLPVKMFEYMNAGLPVIASDFALWRGILEDTQSGLCVDPLDPKAIAAAIDWIVENPEQARLMGENGRQAVATQFNWPAEERKLIALYQSLA
ncbi:glycosyl transferase [Xanthomonas citri pv. mangiferaeindicae]|nr:glycosyl transferase [Xanthomonas citri pv. mangiferaeindicae]